MTTPPAPLRLLCVFCSMAQPPLLCNLCKEGNTAKLRLYFRLMSEEYRQRLSQLDSCVISDVLDRLNLPGVVLGLNRLSTDKKLAGPVQTVKIEAAEGRLPQRPLCSATIERARPGDVIVVEHRSRQDCSGWGGILSRAARVQKVAGVIIEGMCRDVDESRELGFPIFARGAVPVTPRGRVIETGFNVPVTVGTITVVPGDWVIADGSGVVFIKPENLSAVLDEAETIVAREAGLIAQIEAGVPVGQVMSRTYAHMAKK